MQRMISIKEKTPSSSSSTTSSTTLHMTVVAPQNPLHNINHHITLKLTQENYPLWKVVVVVPFLEDHDLFGFLILILNFGITKISSSRVLLFQPCPTTYYLIWLGFPPPVRYNLLWRSSSFLTLKLNSPPWTKVLSQSLFIFKRPKA